MKKSILNKYSLTILGLLLFLLLWWLISYLVGHGNRVFPDPWSTMNYAFILLGQPYTYLCIGWSFLRMLIGFSLSLILGVIVGIIAGNIKRTKFVFNPTMTALKAVPTAALVYLFMVLFGAKWAPIAIVSLICFPMLYESTLGGYTNIEQNIIQSLKLENNGIFHKNIKVLFPLASPYIVVGIASSFALSFKIEIMAEVISGSTSPGIGCVIRQVQQDNPADLLPVFSYALIAIIIMLIIDLFRYFITSYSHQYKREKN